MFIEQRGDSFKLRKPFLDSGKPVSDASINSLEYRCRGAC